MSAGKGSRWGEGSKHLVEIDGEPLLKRTVKQAKKYCKDIYITTNTEEYKTRGAKLYFPQNNTHEIDRFLSNEEIWTNDTVFLYGDVYYTDNAIKKIFSKSTKTYHYFGRYKESTTGGKNHAELFAIRIKSKSKFKEACLEVKKGQNGWGWLTYRYLMGENPNITARELREWLKETKLKNFTEIDDETDDFDTKQDYQSFINRIPRIIHIVWIGGNFPYEQELSLWKHHHPHWEIKLWTDIPKMKNQDTIDKIEVLAGKVDLIRLELLHEYGGVYTDADSYCLKPIDELVKGKALFSATNSRGNMCNSLMGCKKGDPTIKKAIDGIPKYYKEITTNRIPYIHELGTLYLTPILQEDPNYIQIDKGNKPRQLITHESEKNDNTYVVQEHRNSWKTQMGGRMINKPTFSYNIMAHPSRKEYVDYLLTKIDADVIWDKTNNVWDTRKRCLLDHLKKGKDFAITIQDDALLTDNFKEKAEAIIIEKYGHRAYNFFYMKGRHPEEEFIMNKDSGCVRKKFFVNEIAFAIPTSIIPNLIEECDGTDSDAMLARYISKTLETCYPLPSIADHRTIRSIYYGEKANTAERVAWWFEPNQWDKYIKPKFRMYGGRYIYEYKKIKLKSLKELSKEELNDILEAIEKVGFLNGEIKRDNNKIKFVNYGV